MTDSETSCRTCTSVSCNPSAASSFCSKISGFSVTSGPKVNIYDLSVKRGLTVNYEEHETTRIEYIKYYIERCQVQVGGSKNNNVKPDDRSQNLFD